MAVPIGRGLIGAMLCAARGCAVPATEPEPLRLVVMDPLAAPLACDCVGGYAQRDYTRLGAFLEEREPVAPKA